MMHTNKERVVLCTMSDVRTVTRSSFLTFENLLYVYFEISKQRQDKLIYVEMTK